MERLGRWAFRTSRLLILSCICAFSTTGVVGVETNFQQSQLSNCSVSSKGINVGCVFENLAVYNGTVYFISDDEVEVPSVMATLVEVFGGDPVHIKPKVIQSSQLSVLSSSTEVVNMKYGVLVSSPNHHNILHIAGEFLPSMHAGMCNLLGICGVEERNDTMLVNVAPGGLPKHLHYHGPLYQCFKCFGQKERPVWLDEPSFSEKVYVFDKALIGYGPRCFQYCPEGGIHAMGRDPMTGPEFESYRKRMHDCLGLPFPVQSNSNQPTVTVVNRRYGVGRTMLNGKELAEAIQRATGANTREVYMEGLEYVEQARVYHDTSVLVIMHGAAIANCLYMPRNSVIVHLTQHPEYYTNLPTYVSYWTDAMSASNVSMLWNRNTDVDRIQLMMEILHTKAWYPLLNETGRNMLAFDKMCPSDFNELHSCIFESFHTGSNLAVNIDDVVGLVKQALVTIGERA